MKRNLLLLILMALSVFAFAQNKPYDEKADAVQQINNAIHEANRTNKFVLCQVGGNWCPWCLTFADMAQNNDTVKSVIDKNFVYIHVNYSKENKNPEAMRMLRNPARFGFPVFVILDNEGNYLHTQNSVYLEEGKGYNVKKVTDFLEKWTPQSLNTLK
ncbi:MAG: thioredoxin family protein [Bacteroidales bacterium]|nr:thioredoxin family protein [Bacteroidales bacterium]